MKLTKKQLVDIYKKFNSLAGFGKEKTKISTDPFKYIDILTDNKNNYTEADKETAFTSYMAVELYKYHLHDTNSLDNPYEDKEEQIEGNIIVDIDNELDDDKTVIDDSSVMYFVKDEYTPSKDQIDFLKDFVVSGKDILNRVEEVDEKGEIEKPIKRVEYKDSDLNLDNKYEIRIDKSNALKRVFYTDVYDISKKLEIVHDRYNSFTAPLALLDKHAVDFRNSSTYESIKYSLNNNIEQNGLSDIKHFHSLRKGEMEDELIKNVQYYQALKEVVKRKEGTIGRYLNPFNWVRTYRTNKFLKEVKDRITSKFNLTSNDWKYVDKKCALNQPKQSELDKLMPKEELTLVNLKDDQKFQDKYLEDINRAKDMVEDIGFNTQMTDEFEKELLVTSPEERERIKNEFKSMESDYKDIDVEEMINNARYEL